MRFYEELDKIKPYTEVEFIFSGLNKEHWINFNRLIITKGYNYNHKKYGWLYCRINYDASQLYPDTPQVNSIHTETNTSGQGYTTVYQKWSSLIRKIKSDIMDQEITEVNIKGDGSEITRSL